MAQKLKDKKILFIGPKFHNYHDLIIEELIKMGAYVDFYPERDYGTGFKLINNLLPAYLKKYQKAHYANITRKVKQKSYDYLFLIRGYMMPEEFLLDFKMNNPDATLIMYQWDSERTNPFSHLLPFFHQVKSFDFEDCKNFPTIQYLPLFYTDDVVHAIKDKSDALYDFFFMGWFFPERYQSVLDFSEYTRANNYKLKAFLYMPFTTYVKYKLRGVSIDKSIVSFKHMARPDYLKNLADSKVMVDVSNPNQTGLAMRVIESLASHTRVLTNNRRLIEDKRIYDTGVIAFFDENKPVVQADFLNAGDSKKIPGVLSLKEWILMNFNESRL